MPTPIRPITFVWTADGRMAPLPRFKRLCDQQFVVGEEYPLAMLEARSRVSHSHYFASIHDAWKNLPEDIASDFPSAEHMRKWALCMTGWSTMKTFTCESNEHARSLAMFARSADEFAVIQIRGDVVRIHQAKSQAAHIMGKQEFQQSKTDVLDKIAELIGVSTRQLRHEGARTFPEPQRQLSAPEHKQLPPPNRDDR